ncbi:MAG: MarR family winged helix-turn-helix transcriptional regulator [Aerococcus sp.]|nr:MarR family winged helix-turn-helix transcriptional regulator [Aerococcus sp.]
MKVSHFGGMIKAIDIEIQKKINKHLAEVSQDLPRLTGPQLEVLGYLYHHPNKDIYQSDLQDVFNLSRPTINGIIKRLRDIHTVEMTPSPTDKRYKLVQLTPAARQAMEEHHPHMEADLRQMEERMLTGFSEEEIIQLHTSLKKILHNLKQ